MVVQHAVRSLAQHVMFTSAPSTVACLVNLAPSCLVGFCLPYTALELLFWLPASPLLPWVLAYPCAQANSAEAAQKKISMAKRETLQIPDMFYIALTYVHIVCHTHVSTSKHRIEM